MTLQEIRALRHLRLLRIFHVDHDYPHIAALCDSFDRNWWALTHIERALLTAHLGLNPTVPAYSCHRLARLCHCSVAVMRQMVRQTLAKMTPVIVDKRILACVER